jgi:hypothetical protein
MPTGGFGVGPGSAARDTERRNREADPVPRASMGIRVGGQIGRKFEFESGRPQGPGEALPAMPAQPAPVQAAAPVASADPPSAAGRLWGKFRGLFSGKQ